jgi:valyl-tRNA synthetase
MNKIWNASRYVITNCEGRNIKPITEIKLTHADKWIISRLQSAIRDVTLTLNKFELGVACQIMYDFMWSDFCDWYIELTKPALWSDDSAKKDNAVSVLYFVLENALKLLHPFIPFITDEIYRNMPNTQGSIMTKEFPRYNAKLAYKKEAAAFEGVMEIIKAVRNVKTETGCAPSKKVTLYIVTENKRLISANSDSILKLAGAEEIKFITSAEDAGPMPVTKVVSIGTIYIPMGELVDLNKEKARLEGELDKVMAEIRRADGKLNNQGFMAKAPKKLVDEEREKLEKYMEMRQKILAQIESLNV